MILCGYDFSVGRLFTEFAGAAENMSSAPAFLLQNTWHSRKKNLILRGVLNIRSGSECLKVLKKR